MSDEDLRVVERPVVALPDAELPVVARLIVEVRSDGTRTVARGALEDLTTGERTVLAMTSGGPRALLASLLSAGRTLAKRLVPSRAARQLRRRSD